MDNLLSILTFLPLIAAFFTAIIKGDEPEAQSNAKWLAFAATGATFLISLALLVQFEPGLPGLQLIEQRAWLFGLNYSLGVDGVSVVFVLLTTFIMPIAVVSAWSITARIKELMMSLLVLETMLIGSFVATDAVLFFVFAQGALVPVFLLLSLWGGADRLAAALKLGIVAVFGGALMLAAILLAAQDAGSTDLGRLAAHQFSSEPVMLLGMEVSGGLQTLCFIGFFAAFAVYLALWPLHTWLPDAAASAPAPGALVIVALVTKIGGYGLIRVCLPLFPDAAATFGAALSWLGVVAVIWAALAALSQDNFKRLLAYLTVAQAGLILIGIFSGTDQGLDGAVLLMVAHALAIAGLFTAIMVLQDHGEEGRGDGSDLGSFGGLIVNMPAFSLVIVVFALAIIGMPGGGGFMGLMLTLIGAAASSPWVAALAGLVLALAAAAVLTALRRLVFGDFIKDSARGLSDLNLRERALFVPLAAAVLILGLAPMLILDLTAPATELLVISRDQALAVPLMGGQPAASN